MAGKAGRPSIYSDEIGEEIAARLVGLWGDDEPGQCEFLKTICADRDMPSMRTVFRWLSNPSKEFDKFRQLYAQARRMQLEECYPSEIIEIADDARNDFIEKLNRKGEVFIAFDRENVERSKLRVDARKFLMARLVEKFSGPTGSDDRRIKRVIVEVIPKSEKDG